MSGHLGNPLMLLGLLGLAIPIIVHLLNRRRTEVIDWGAMQFLDVGRRARRRIQITDLMLMAGRMLILGLVALALARPFLTPREAAAGAEAPGVSRTPRDVVLVLDGSPSMERQAGGGSARQQAVRWAQGYVRDLPPGSSVSLLMAGHRVRPLVDVLSYDRQRLAAALASAPASRDPADLAAALAEALRRLDEGRNRHREILVLTDGRKRPWRLDEPRRWELLRELQREGGRRSGVPVRIGVVDFRPAAPVDGPDGRVGPLELPRGLVPPLGPIHVGATVSNDGPGPLTRTAELLVDGEPVSGLARVVGPVPAGGAMPVSFRTEIARPGSHALTIRLAPGDDPLTANDASSRAIEVIPALPVLLVDGEPGREPLTGETDFLRAALAPTGDATPQVAARVVPLASFTGDDLRGVKVVVLANVERLGPTLASTLARFVGGGGGILVAPGDRTSAEEWNQQLYRDGRGWLPAQLGELRGDFARRKVVARPAPATFSGTSLAPLGQGDSPALGQAELFAYYVLTPASAPPGRVLARLDTGDPWLVERDDRKGRVACFAGPLDAEGGTMPVNPDFVPLMHELVYHLADAGTAAAVRPGEVISAPLGESIDPNLTSVAVVPPSGGRVEATVIRGDGPPRGELAATDEPGLYRFDRPPPAGPFYAMVAADPREEDGTPLGADDQARLAEGWPLAIGRDADRIAGRASRTSAGPRSFWRGLVLAALAGLCLEVWLTRRMVRDRGVPFFAEDGPG